MPRPATAAAMRGCGVAVAPPCARCRPARARASRLRPRAAAAPQPSQPPPPPPPPPPSRRRTAKNPADWGRDYDAIREDLQRSGSGGGGGFIGNSLNFIAQRFGGASGTRRRGGGLGAALLDGAYALLSRLGAPPDASFEGPHDPTPLVRAAARASPAERSAADAAWGGVAAQRELAVLLACGCVARSASRLAARCQR